MAINISILQMNLWIIYWDINLFSPRYRNSRCLHWPASSESSLGLSVSFPQEEWIGPHFQIEDARRILIVQREALQGLGEESEAPMAQSWEPRDRRQMKDCINLSSPPTFSKGADHLVKGLAWKPIVLYSWMKGAVAWSLQRRDPMFKLGIGEPPGFEGIKILWPASISVLITMQSGPEAHFNGFLEPWSFA